MRVAVLTLTRDRLDYTKHCFERLRELAGCDYDHFILDQGSIDETVRWLDGYDPHYITCSPVNVGIAVGINTLLVQAREYDVVVKFDNDCEIVTPNCLRDVAEASKDLNALLSPRINGLRFPPSWDASVTVGKWKVNLVNGNIGGIFLAAPGSFYDGWHYKGEASSLPVWGMDDVLTCQVARERDMIVGYLDGYEANHYRTTDGQHTDFPEYFARRVSEGGPP